MFQAAAALIMVLIANAAFALLRETDINYFLDDAYLCLVGEEVIDCDGNYALYGSLGYYRVWDQYRCSDGARVWHKCQQTDGMGGWITVDCPAHYP